MHLHIPDSPQSHPPVPTGKNGTRFSQKMKSKEEALTSSFAGAMMEKMKGGGKMTADSCDRKRCSIRFCYNSYNLVEKAFVFRLLLSY